MAFKIGMVETYGINPPQNSKPLWSDSNILDEDNIIASIDLQASLQKLSEREREIILLINQGYVEREIAEMIDINYVNVHRIRERATSKLKEMMNGKDTIHSLFT